ncbi:MAG: hypothetical protein JEZ06_24300 [Anaerolineaceae bacterium]|nr:hypothetical protein [Anaerolineaceae bacterium]
MIGEDPLQGAACIHSNSHTADEVMLLHREGVHILVVMAPHVNRGDIVDDGLDQIAIAIVYRLGIFQGYW